MVTAGSLLADIPDRLEAERFDQLLKVANIRIERIVSTGQTTPPGEWFDQAWDEWVLLISGAAEIILAEEDVPRLLKPGDYLFTRDGRRRYDPQDVQDDGPLHQSKAKA